MEIAINIGWSILSVIFFILLIYLFQEKIGNNHKFLAFMICSAGMCLFGPEYLKNSEFVLMWIGIMFMPIFFCETFLASVFLSLQSTLLGMYGLYHLPQYSYTWASTITNYVLSKAGVVTLVIIGGVFLLGILLESGHTESNTNTQKDEGSSSNSSNDSFSFANGYRKGNDESVYYSLYSSSDNYATLKDDHGNQFNVYIWNKGEGTVKDDAGNIYFPW